MGMGGSPVRCQKTLPGGNSFSHSSTRSRGWQRFLEQHPDHRPVARQTGDSCSFRSGLVNRVEDGELFRSGGPEKTAVRAGEENLQPFLT
jgi:hypothetical protein